MSNVNGTESLYGREVAGAYAKFCGGNSGNTGESCMQIADLAGGGFSLTDSKPEGAGRELRMSEDEVVSFARGFLNERGLSL
ncbi:DUF397 domain-containing protein [Streptomyces sp. NBC_01207]|uniref:DUF397 domain-containing protein n=1 Tax=Streptomyces sp. NBC_01207 TaxID=2903772 RepID=UPI002E11569A|nr:DUF397 domain-containing protein [Streptomyces sp. NBC_01207]